MSSNEHVTDIVQIGSYGVIGTPALVINKKVVAVGTAPPKAKIKTWRQDAHRHFRRCGHAHLTGADRRHFPGLTGLG